MFLSSLNVDSKGDSFFTRVETTHPGNGPYREMDVAYWQLWETQPGHFQDFKASDAPRCLAVMSGKLAITSSLGETRHFARGDTFLLQDVAGKGHAVRTYGAEPCTVLLITMKQIMPPTGEEKNGA
jgi:hypothetical protein